MMTKVQKAVIAFISLISVCAAAFYYLESARIKISVINLGEKNGLAQVVSIVGGEKQSVHRLDLNGRTTFRFHTSKEWQIEKNAPELSVQYSPKDTSDTVLIPFPKIEENKSYHFVVFINEDKKFLVSEIDD